MKQYYLVLIFFTILLSGSNAAFAEDSIPDEIGGFKLGTSVDDYEFISYRNFLKQVVVENVGQFRKGLIQYGVCERPGEIVKIKLKYKDASPAFYKQLLKRYKQKLGEPDRYTGDAFGILKAWKWHFTDKQGEKISLTLQYNKKDLNESLGSVVKLSMPGRVEAERLCFNKVCATREDEIEPPSKLDWEFLVPR